MMAGWGIGLGITMSLWVSLLISSVGIENYQYSVSACGLVLGIGFLLAGPLLGKSLKALPKVHCWALKEKNGVILT